MLLELDTVLALFIPFVILFLAYRVIPSLDLFPTSRTTATGIFSTQRAYHAYKQYHSLSKAEIARLHLSYRTLGRAHKRIGYNVGYPAKLKRLEDVTEANARVTDAIARFAGSTWDLDDLGSTTVDSADLSRVREALRHFVRDWSHEGAPERKKIFEPILDILRCLPKGNVLVPGSGLGRLAWEISQLGFDTTAVELSSYMTFAMRFILKAEAKDAYTIFPYAHWFSHQRSNESLFRSVSFPDALPRLSDSFRLVEGDFLGHRGKYAYIVTLFFIDTSTNVFTTLEHIHSLLEDDGLWINLGPLLWMSGGAAKVELSLEEVIHAATEVGFDIVDEPRTVECEYTADGNAMMQWVYRAELWTARKRKM